jgi:hypothetical protein
MRGGHLRVIRASYNLRLAMSDSAVPTGAPRREKSSAGCGLALIWAFALFWYGLLAIVSFAFLHTNRHVEPGLYAMLGVFGAAGLFLVVVAVRTTRDAFRFRGLELDLQPSLGVLGGKIHGVFRVSRRILRLAPLDARIVVYRRRRGSHRGPDEPLWESSDHPLMTRADGLTMPFSIDLPYDAEPTSYDFYWNVELRARGRKSSFGFDVPVERTAESSEAQTMATLRPAVTTAPERSDIKLTRGLNGIEIELPSPTWAWKWWVFVVIVGVVGTVAANVVLAPMREEGMPLPFVIAVYAGIAVVVLFLAACILFSLAFTVRRIRVDRSRIEIGYALGRKSTHAARAEVQDVTASYAQSSLRYNVVVTRTNGMPMLGSVVSLKTKREADWIATEVRRALLGTV